MRQNYLGRQIIQNCQITRKGGLGRLNSLVKRLQKDPYLLEKYDNIIKDQLAGGIVEKAPSEANGKEFYIPHKPVVRESAESPISKDSI